MKTLNIQALRKQARDLNCGATQEGNHWVAWYGKYHKILHYSLQNEKDALKCAIAHAIGHQA